MSDVDEIVAQIPMAQLAAQLGVDEQTAEQATRNALPALLGGMGANAAVAASATSSAGCWAAAAAKPDRGSAGSAARPTPARRGGAAPPAR